MPDLHVISGQSLVTRARDDIADAVLRSDAETLLFIGSGIGSTRWRQASTSAGAVA